MTLKRIIILILIALAAAYGSYSLVKFLTRAKTGVTPVTNQQKTDASLQTQKLNTQFLQQAAKADSDLDGFPDAEEKTLGTDPKKVDSDGDGVSDYDEVKVFKTDPLNKDTLKIGHTDSWAVQHGIIDASGARHSDLLKKYTK